jgi:hypothetical protein
MPIGTTGISLDAVVQEHQVFNPNDSLETAYSYSASNGFAKINAGMYHNLEIGDAGGTALNTYGVYIANRYINVGANYELGRFARYNHGINYSLTYEVDLTALDNGYTIQVDFYIVDENNNSELVYTEQFVGDASYSDTKFANTLKPLDTNIPKILSYRYDIDVTLIAGTPDPVIAATTGLFASDTDGLGPNQTRFTNESQWGGYTVTGTPSGQIWAVDGDDTGNPTICGNKRTTIGLVFVP